MRRVSYVTWRMSALAACICIVGFACRSKSQSVSEVGGQEISRDKGLVLNDQPIPSVDQVTNTLKIAKEPYISDDTYAADPKLLLGKVAEIDRINDSCVAAARGEPVWVGKVTGLKFTGALTKPVLRYSMVTNRALAAQISLLDYLSASLDDSSVYSLEITDQDIERVNDSDPSYKAGRDNWIRTNQALMNDHTVCWLLQVDGFTFKTINKKKFTRSNAKAGGGTFGVKANGSYYASNEDYSLDYRFGLSFTFIKRPSTRGPAGISAAEVEMLKRITRIRDKR